MDGLARRRNSFSITDYYNVAGAFRMSATNLHIEWSQVYTLYHYIMEFCMRTYLLLLTLLLSVTSVFAQSDRGLSRLIAADLAMDEEQVFQVIKRFKHHTIDSLRHGKVVRLQGLGRFYVEYVDAKPNGNPRTGETRPIPAKNYLRFKPSKVGNQSLN